MLCASDPWFSTGARALARGNIRSVGDEWLNPAELPLTDGKRISLSVLDRFRMSELSTAELAFACPNRFLDAGCRFTTFGYADYRIMQWQSGFAKTIRTGCTIGLQLNARHTRSRWADNVPVGLSAGLGLHYRLNERLDLALLGEHLLRLSTQETARGQVGCRYRMSPALVFFTEVATGGKARSRFSVGADYLFSESLRIRSGYDSERGMPAFGAGYAWSCWMMDVGFALHSTLGISSIISATYAF